MSVYSYARISENEALEDKSYLESMLEQENLKLQTYALGQGMRVCRTFLDDGQKWTVDFKSRKQASLLLETVEIGDIILANTVQRIFSSCDDMLSTINILKSKGVKLIVVELGGDVTRPGFCPPFNALLYTFQKLEKRRSAERIRTVKQNQRRKGRFLGGSRPFGYMIHSNGSLIENPMEQQVLKKIIKMKQKGKSLRAISSEVSTPMMPVSFKTVQRLLKRHQDRMSANEQQTL